MKATHINHEFIESAPEQLAQGQLYISMQYATTTHLCCCGCGNDVVLPLDPTAWRVTYDGETVSLFPSVGNWNFPCQSHYWIEGNRIRWSDAWTHEQIEVGRRRTLEERGVAAAEDDIPTPKPWRRRGAALRRSFGSSR